MIVIGTYGEKLGHVDGKGKGLYVVRFDKEKQAFSPAAGTLGKPQLGNLKNPTYLTAYRATPEASPVLYIVDERNDGAGTVSAATLDETTGKLTAIGPAIPAVVDAKGKKGAACCHVSVSPGGEHVLAANYLGGSVVAIGRKADGSLDASRVQYLMFPPRSHKVAFPGPNAGRQDGSHAHMCLFSQGTDRTTVLVPDLGSDVVWSVPYDASSKKAPLGEPVATAVGHKSLQGGGPRHAALHPTKPIAYVAYELSSQAAAFGIDPRTGALDGKPPLCVCNVLDGKAAAFLGGGGGEASSSGSGGGGSSKRQRGGGKGGYADLVQAGGVCSDKSTSIAAARVTPSGSHIIVSNRIVGAPGSLSAIPLLPSGKWEAGVKASITSTLGHTPRDFALLSAATSAGAGKRKRKAADEAAVLALAANQDTDEIALLCGGAQPRVLAKAVPTPVCLCVL